MLNNQHKKLTPIEEEEIKSKDASWLKTWTDLDAMIEVFQHLWITKYQVYCVMEAYAAQSSSSISVLRHPKITCKKDKEEIMVELAVEENEVR